MKYFIVILFFAIATNSVRCEESFWEVKKNKIRPKLERDKEADESTFGVQWDFKALANPTEETNIPISFITKGVWLDDSELNQEGFKAGLEAEVFGDIDLFDGEVFLFPGIEVTTATNQKLKDEQYFASAKLTIALPDYLPSADFYYDFVKDNEDQVSKGLPMSNDEYRRFRAELHWFKGLGPKSNQSGDLFFLEARARYFKESGRGVVWAQSDLDDGFQYLIRVEYSPVISSAPWLKAIFTQFTSGREYSGELNQDKIAIGIRI